MSIHLNEITKILPGGRILFENVAVSFNPGNRYGLTGPNGSGKSTLLKMIMRMEEPTSGSISAPARIGMLRQDIEKFRDDNVKDVVMMGNPRLWRALQEREHLYAQEITDAVGMRLGELEEIIAEEDGYVAESNAETLLSGAGVAAPYHELKMESLPTDLQFRTLLCQALFGNPESLLLDEPTNNLDLESIGWLEDFLHRYPGTLLVVSHDRHFLNAVTTHIADIDFDTIFVYPGNYDQMLITKTSARERSELEARSKEKKIAQLKEFVARFGAGTRASQVQSRLREIERLQPQELKKSNIQRPYVRFPSPEKSPGQIVCSMKDVSKGYDGLPVIEHFSCEIHRGDKIGVIGNNGRGKSTLIKMIAGRLPPDEGSITYGHHAAISYFPQIHTDLIEKDKDISLFDWLRERRQGLYDQDIRSVLGKMLFSGDDAFKKIGNLSGGETARLILAGMMLEEHNFLILDEPNNHLDLEAVSALGWGLNEYKGTVVVVSHDRDLIDRCAKKIIAFEKGGIQVFDGNFENYIHHKEKAGGS